MLLNQPLLAILRKVPTTGTLANRVKTDKTAVSLKKSLSYIHANERKHLDKYHTSQLFSL